MTSPIHPLLPFQLLVASGLQHSRVKLCRTDAARAAGDAGSPACLATALPGGISTDICSREVLEPWLQPWVHGTGW